MDLRLNDIDLNKLDELFNIDECNKTFADFSFRAQRDGYV